MSRNRLMLIAGLVLLSAVVAGVLIAVGNSGEDDPYVKAAQQRCQTDVRNRLASPSTATLAGIAVSQSELDPDTTDKAPLSREALAGVDPSRIIVRSVTGTVQAPNAFGDMLNDPFTCRAYFVDGSLAETLVVFEHDH